MNARNTPRLCLARNSGRVAGVRPIPAQPGALRCPRSCRPPSGRARPGEGEPGPLPPPSGSVGFGSFPRSSPGKERAEGTRSVLQRAFATRALCGAPPAALSTEGGGGGDAQPRRVELQLCARPARTSSGSAVPLRPPSSRWGDGQRRAQPEPEGSGHRPEMAVCSGASRVQPAALKPVSFSPLQCRHPPIPEVPGSSSLGVLISPCHCVVIVPIFTFAMSLCQQPT